MPAALLACDNSYSLPLDGMDASDSFSRYSKEIGFSIALRRPCVSSPAATPILVLRDETVVPLRSTKAIPAALSVSARLILAWPLPAPPLISRPSLGAPDDLLVCIASYSRFARRMGVSRSARPSLTRPSARSTISLPAALSYHSSALWRARNTLPLVVLACGASYSRCARILLGRPTTASMPAALFLPAAPSRFARLSLFRPSADSE
jgi:hypothetical protein